jgi:hypothetical protein
METIVNVRAYLMMAKKVKHSVKINLNRIRTEAMLTEVNTVLK